MDLEYHSRHFSKRKTMSAIPVSSRPTPISSSSPLQAGSNVQWTSQPPYKAGGIAEMRFRNTISKDKIKGDEQRIADLMAQHGNKVMRSQHMAVNADKSHSALNSSVNTVSGATFGGFARIHQGDLDLSANVVDDDQGAESDASSKSEYHERGKRRMSERLVDEDSSLFLAEPGQFAHNSSGHNDGQSSMQGRDSTYSTSTGFTGLANVTPKVHGYDDVKYTRYNHHRLYDNVLYTPYHSERPR